MVEFQAPRQTLEADKGNQVGEDIDNVGKIYPYHLSGITVREALCVSYLESFQ